MAKNTQRTERPSPKCRPYFKTHRLAAERAQLEEHVLKARAAGAGPWSVPELCAAYAWPTKLVGGGTIAIVELGGGYTRSDMETYFKSIGQPMPQLVDVSVDGTRNTPGEDADGEVALDIQVAAASYFVATEKSASIRIYWSRDIANAVRAAAKDGCDVCSISWGADEAEWGKIAASDMEAAAHEATEAGMIIFAASGDNDSGDGGPTPANVDLPAACPHVVGCGGTKKTRSDESVWNNAPGNPNGEGSGGGFSTLFARPTWQQGAPTPPTGLGRCVPDVAANADPDTGYEIYYGGRVQIVGGTSAVSPLLSGLFAALGTKLGHLYSIPGFLWDAPRPAFVDIVKGDNGMYKARPGPDACTGLGVPNGVGLKSLFAPSLTKPVQTPPTPTPVGANPPPAPAPVKTPVQQPAPKPAPAPPTKPTGPSNPVEIGPTLDEAVQAITDRFNAGAREMSRHTAIKHAIEALRALYEKPGAVMFLAAPGERVDVK